MTKNVSTSKKKLLNKQCCRTCVDICLLITGTFLLVCGLGILVNFDAIFDNLIKFALTFDDGSGMFDGWKVTPPITVKFYLFNWTNSKETLHEGAKPKFQEVGPYVFTEIREKINVTWNRENHTISYRHKRTFWLDAENSVRNLSDVITTINIIPLSIAYRARDAGYLTKKLISYSLSSKSTIFVTTTAGEILFDGYEDGVLSTLSSVPLAGIPDKFGLFYGRNGTSGYDGIYNMFTENEGLNFGRVSAWDYENHTNFFGDGCNGVSGSAGEFFPLNSKKDTIEVFSPEMCKIARFEYEKDVEVKGVKGFKYSGKYIFDNGTSRPENDCFCDGECIPTGVFNISSCSQGAPMFLSMPHFYNADPSYTEAIDGLKSEDRHEFYITLEPKTGVIIDISAKMQLNVLLQPVKYIAMYDSVPKIFVPVFYTTREVVLKDDYAPYFRIIQNMPKISTITAIIMMVIGIGIYVWYGLKTFCCTRKQKEIYIEMHHKQEQQPLWG